MQKNKTNETAKDKKTNEKLLSITINTMQTTSNKL